MKLHSKINFIRALESLNLNENNNYLLHVSLIGIGLIPGVKPEKLSDFIFYNLKKN